LQLVGNEILLKNAAETAGFMVST